MNSNCIIITPPPTPNGALHIGHVAGPFFRADIYKRLISYLAPENKSLLLTHTDNYQSYVHKKSLQADCDPINLSSKNSEKIRIDFHNFKIGIDNFGNNRDEEYKLFFFKAIDFLIERLDVVASASEACSSCDSDLYESFVRGHCSHCFHECYANVCENCNMPQSKETLITPKCETCGTESRYQVSKTIAHTFQISERNINSVSDMYSGMENQNPGLTNFYRNLSEHRLNITYDAKYGIGMHSLPGVVNPWIEIYFYHFFQSARALNIDTSQSIDVTIALFNQAAKDTEFVYFFGIDNTYYYAFLFPYFSQILGLTSFLPTSLKINKFLQLNNRKISTSRGNVIWASEILKESKIQKLRRNLMLCCPEFDEKGYENKSDLDFIDNIQDIETNHSIYISAFKSRLTRLVNPHAFSVSEITNTLLKAKEFSDQLNQQGDEISAKSLMLEIKNCANALGL